MYCLLSKSFFVEGRGWGGLHKCMYVFCMNLRCYHNNVKVPLPTSWDCSGSLSDVCFGWTEYKGWPLATQKQTHAWRQCTACANVLRTSPPTLRMHQVYCISPRARFNGNKICEFDNVTDEAGARFRCGTNDVKTCLFWNWHLITESVCVQQSRSNHNTSSAKTAWMTTSHAKVSQDLFCSHREHSNKGLSVLPSKLLLFYLWKRKRDSN